MLITFKTLQQMTFKIEIDEEETVRLVVVVLYVLEQSESV